MYDTQLTPQEEQQYQNWFAVQQKMGNIPPNDTGADYDYRGAFKANQVGQMMPSHGEVHWLDTYKKPNHPSFSNESMYATGDNAQYAGRWVNPNTPQEQYVPPATRYPQGQLINMLHNLFS